MAAWCGVFNGHRFLFDSDRSEQAFNLIAKLLDIYGFASEPYVKNDTIWTIFATTKDLDVPWHSYQLMLISQEGASVILQDKSIADCAKRIYTAIANDYVVHFGSVNLDKTSVGVGEFMLNYVLLGF